MITTIKSNKKKLLSGKAGLVSVWKAVKLSINNVDYADKPILPGLIIHTINAMCLTFKHVLNSSVYVTTGTLSIDQTTQESKPTGDKN